MKGNKQDLFVHIHSCQGHALKTGFHDLHKMSSIQHNSKIMVLITASV